MAAIMRRLMQEMLPFSGAQCIKYYEFQMKVTDFTAQHGGHNKPFHYLTLPLQTVFFWSEHQIQAKSHKEKPNIFFRNETEQIWATEFAASPAGFGQGREWQFEL